MTAGARQDGLEHVVQPAFEQKRLREELDQLKTSVISSFATLLDLKEQRTGRDSNRLAEWALWIGQELGISEEDLYDIQVASLLRDIGKAGVPDEILHKPTRLTEHELAMVRKHPECGWAVLRLLPGFERIALYVLHHHEWLDGNGYPGGLSGGEIPLGARVVGVLDAFDAMLSSRSYRQGLTAAEAADRLVAISRSQLDPEVVGCFVSRVQAQLIPSSADHGAATWRASGSGLGDPAASAGPERLRELAGGAPLGTSNPFRHRAGELPSLAVTPKDRQP
jgi:HD-GYP domain-containing protein (c-di-GMP phosphodiesterase class II)